MSKPSVEGFQFAAEDYCALISRAEPFVKGDLWRFRELLVRLIFNITAVESHQHSAGFEGQGIGDDEFLRVVGRLHELPFGFYRVVFDPHDFEAKDEPVMGLLSDDLADIYRDLAEGVDNARNGHMDDACFDWAQSYMLHWSRHAVNALAAIEIYRTSNFERTE